MSKANRFFKTPANNIKFLETQIFLGVGRVSDLIFLNEKNKNYGFSLIEMIVVVAIMAVLVVVLSPALLQYNERSRAEKDNSSMDEVVNAVQLALADPGVYDEVLRFSTVDNISCYVDTNSEANYQKVVTKINPDGVDQYTFLSDARQLDETPYFAAGNMRGVTITFAPDKGSNGSTYDLKQGVVNQYVQVSDNQRVGAMPELYNQIRSVVGDEIFNNSQTYRNSEYTIFIRLGTTGGNDAAKQDSIQAYGQWSGTNLPAAVSYQLVQDRTVGDTGNTITDINDNKWNAENGNKVTINPGDLNGGGSFDNSTIDGNADIGIVYAYLTNDNTLVLRNSPRESSSDLSKDYGLLDFTQISRNWGDDAEIIQNVKIETKIYPKNCVAWFQNCYNLQQIHGLDNLRTDYATSFKDMFSDCQKITHLDLRHFNTSRVFDMSGMFYNCKTVKSIDVTNFDTSNVINMSQMFNECWLLEKVDVSGFDTSKVTNMYFMFDQCESVKEIDVSGWNTENCTNMHAMFAHLIQIKELDVSNFKTDKVTSMAHMFHRIKVNTIDVSGFNTKNVTDMYGMFDQCSNVTRLDVGHFDVSKVTRMSRLFAGCGLLKELNLSNWNVSNVTDMYGMFAEDRELVVLHLSGWNPPSCDKSQMFKNCVKLQDVGNIEHWDVTTSQIQNMFLNCNAMKQLPSWYSL